MLKKNLHFFTRCVILFSIAAIILPFYSCKMREENYLAFLDGELSFLCDIEYCEEKIAVATVEKNDEAVTVTFISPSSLEGTILKITPEGAVMLHDGRSLSQAAIPRLWLKLEELLTKDKKIVAITYNNGITEIHTEGENGIFDYQTDTNGNLLSVDNGTLRLTVKEGN